MIEFLMTYWWWFAIGAIFYLVACWQYGMTNFAAELLSIILYLTIWPLAVLMMLGNEMAKLRRRR